MAITKGIMRSVGSIALLGVSFGAHAATVVSTFSDTACQNAVQEASGPTNGTCVGVIRGSSWMVTSWDDGCLVHMADDLYGDDNLRSCSSITALAQTAYTQHCYSSELNFTHYSITNCSAAGSSDYELRSVEGGQTRTMEPSGILLDGRPVPSGSGNTATGAPQSTAVATGVQSASASGNAAANSNAQGQQENGNVGSSSGSSSGLGRDATIAIGVAVPVGVIFAAVAAGLIIRKKRKQRYADSRRRHEAEEQHGRSELEGPGKAEELESPRTVYELGDKESVGAGRMRVQELG